MTTLEEKIAARPLADADAARLKAWKTAADRTIRTLRRAEAYVIARAADRKK